MTSYKTFSEDADISHVHMVFVNDVEVITIQEPTEDMVLSQLHKADKAIEKELLEQYEDMEEPTYEDISSV